ncbi:MAG: hypothetical protein AB1349_07975 [Elusimicrobiota bacterium]
MILMGFVVLGLVLCALFLHAYDNGLVDVRVRKADGLRPSPYNIDWKKTTSKNRAMAKMKFQNCRNILHKAFVDEPKAPRRKEDRRKADRGSGLAWAYVIPSVLVVLALINEFVR